MNNNRFDPELLTEPTDAQIITEFNLGYDPRPGPLLTVAELEDLNVFTEG
ncbi:MAG: hypothetical protein JWQ87_5232 [Candidatus Sulfotelmatobacter sp.]|nr:hypothetical protein [Candidatus Sulfotelmatobacter sp.]